jgi:diguanylate cyclase (GGDEF)-like protein
VAFFYSYGELIPEIKQSLINASNIVNRQAISVELITGALLFAVFTKFIYYQLTKDPSFFYLAGYCGISLILILLTDTWLIEQTWQQAFIPSTIALTLYFYLQHSHHTLALSRSKTTSRVIKQLPSIFVALAALLLLLPPATSVILITIVTTIVIAPVTMTLSYLSYHKNKAAITQLTALLLIILSIAVAGLSYFEFITTRWPSNADLVKIGLVGQLVLLYTLSSHKFISQSQRRTNEHNQAQMTIANLKESLSLEQQQSEALQLDLEAVVSERTFELNMALQELQETNKRLEQQSTIDALTGIKNRKFFDQRYSAEQLLSRRQQTPLSLLLLDADKFKLVNDNYGHLTGDQVLIAICKRASKVLKRPNDNVCRYGGEEFAILLPNTDTSGAKKVAEAIRHEIADTLVIADSHQLKITVSIGVSTVIVEPNLHPDALFAAADKALYQAKQAGRNQVAVADPIDDDDKITKEYTIE